MRANRPVVVEIAEQIHYNFIAAIIDREKLVPFAQGGRRSSYAGRESFGMAVGGYDQRLDTGESSGYNCFSSGLNATRRLYPAKREGHWRTS